MQARVNVPDDRFRWLCSTYKPKSEVPAFLEIVDIAGLVKYAFALSPQTSPRLCGNAVHPDCHRPLASVRSAIGQSTAALMLSLNLSG